MILRYLSYQIYILPNYKKTYHEPLDYDGVLHALQNMSHCLPIYFTQKAYKKRFFSKKLVFLCILAETIELGKHILNLSAEDNCRRSLITP